MSSSIPSNPEVFESKEELDTIVRLHDQRMSEEILSATIPDLVDVVSYRGGANKHLQLCARQMNSFMRANYTGFIHSVGRNIYPLIIASDFEPGFEGVGSSFTLYLRDGSQHKVAPTVSSDYEILKALSHMSLAMFIILSPHFENPTNIQWRGKISELKGQIEIFQDAAKNAKKDTSLIELVTRLAQIYLAYINRILADGTFTLSSFLEFTSEAFAMIRINMAEATMAQASAVLPAMLKWKKMLGPAEWSKVYVMIPTVWPVALNSPRLQLFEHLIDADKIHTHIITSEHPRNFEEARDVLGRVVGDRAVGRLVFGTKDTKAKMKVLALSSRTDVVADDFEIALNRVIADLSAEDRALINEKSPAPSASSPAPSGCPMHAVREAKRSEPTAPVLNVRRAKLIGREGYWDVLTTPEGMIKSILPSALEQATYEQGSDFDAQGKLLLPGLVDAHVHLDKAYLLDRCCALKGDFAEAMTETLAAKKGFTREDVSRRARRLIENEIAFGTTLLRTHVEVDPIVGLKALEALIPLREEYAKAITIQIAVFAQEGITNQPGQVDLLRSALALGCDVIGSAPYCDPDARENIKIIFDLAQEFNLPVDFHLDYFLEDKESNLNAVIEETIQRGWENKVCLGHMTHLSTFSLEQLEATAERLRTAGISILSLPASDVCMMARGDYANRRRGVCPVQELCRLGVNAAFATNNVQNLFTFTGDGDVLKVGTLLCQMLQLTSESSAQLCLDMATTLSARALGVEHGLAEGLPADFLLLADLDIGTAMETLAAPPSQRSVFKRGRLVSQTLSKRNLTF